MNSYLAREKNQQAEGREFTGGDAYVIVLMRTESKAHARCVVQRIDDALRQDAKYFAGRAMHQYTLHPMAVY